MGDIFRGFGVEIKLAKPADFLVVKETLTRMGVPHIEDKILYQSCYILHKQGRYAIIHFHELNAMDGRGDHMEQEDIASRNKIVALLAEWDLVVVLAPEKIEDQIAINQMKILNFKEKGEWVLVPKYKFLERKLPD
jgi:hypothetical protein